MAKKEEPAAEADTTRKICGLIRPIADMAEYTAKHWREVHEVLVEAVSPIGYNLRLVSESDVAGVILNEIVSNLYLDEIIIADVSGRNPNVMFELGMRLAFEKPAIIIADDETPFSFDISSIKHIRYPRSLRYSEIVRFKDDVATAVIGTVDASSKADYKGYLQQFGPIKVTELASNSVELSSLAADVQDIKRGLAAISRSQTGSSTNRIRKLMSLEVDKSETRVMVRVKSDFISDFINVVNEIIGVVSAVRVDSDLAIITFGGDKLANTYSVIMDYVERYSGKIVAPPLGSSG